MQIVVSHLDRQPRFVYFEPYEARNGPSKRISGKEAKLVGHDICIDTLDPQRSSHARWLKELPGQMWGRLSPTMAYIYLYNHYIHN